MTSYIEAPADDVIVWCEATIDRIGAERKRRKDEAVQARLATLCKSRDRWMRILPRWLYNPPEPTEAKAFAQLEAEDADTVRPGPLYGSSEYAFQAAEVAERLYDLAGTAAKVGSPVFLTADDHRHIRPR